MEESDVDKWKDLIKRAQTRFAEENFDIPRPISKVQPSETLEFQQLLEKKKSRTVLTRTPPPSQGTDIAEGTECAKPEADSFLSKFLPNTSVSNLEIDNEASISDEGSDGINLTATEFLKSAVACARANLEGAGTVFGTPLDETDQLGHGILFHDFSHYQRTSPEGDAFLNYVAPVTYPLIDNQPTISEEGGDDINLTTTGFRGSGDDCEGADPETVAIFEAKFRDTGQVFKAESHGHIENIDGVGFQDFSHNNPRSPNDTYSNTNSDSDSEPLSTGLNIDCTTTPTTGDCTSLENNDSADPTKPPSIDACTRSRIIDSVAAAQIEDPTSLVSTNSITDFSLVLKSPTVRPRSPAGVNPPDFLISDHELQNTIVLKSDAPSLPTNTDSDSLILASPTIHPSSDCTPSDLSVVSTTFQNPIFSPTGPNLNPTPASTILISTDNRNSGSGESLGQSSPSMRPRSTAFNLPPDFLSAQPEGLSQNLRSAHSRSSIQRRRSQGDHLKSEMYNESSLVLQRIVAALPNIPTFNVLVLGAAKSGKTTVLPHDSNLVNSCVITLADYW